MIELCRVQKPGINMALNNSNSVTYTVVGRYMTGSAVTGYHLVGSDGNQAPITKERLIYMIGKGLVENMRVQANGSELILRGKGINLNTLPVYDEKTKGLRGNAASQDAANSAVVPKKNSGINPMGQLKISKRIMFKTSCLGYMVVDHSGREMKLSRDKVIELALQKLISNATVQRYTEPGEDTPRFILRGAGCDLSELPALLVDGNGKIIDPTADRSEIKMRATRMKRGGIIHDKVKSIDITFQPGDFLVCGIKCVIRSLSEADMNSKFKVDTSSNMAICDEYLENLKNYTVEIFGTVAREIKPEQIMKWTIIGATKK